MYAYNRRIRDEKKLAELMAAREEAQTSYDHALEEAEYCRKVMRRARSPRRWRRTISLMPQPRLMR